MLYTMYFTIPIVHQPFVESYRENQTESCYVSRRHSENLRSIRCTVLSKEPFNIIHLALYLKEMKRAEFIIAIEEGTEGSERPSHGVTVTRQDIPELARSKRVTVAIVTTLYKKK